ncbi:alpha-L-arabinofuranosidase C-terminal domain-containing protein, partial [uncultured Bifidobacterium sp.]
PSKTPEGIGNWPVAPRLLEDIYTAADAVVFGDLMITLLKNADRVHAASLAQLVNVIAPIMTEPGGPAWRQTTFYPFSLTARLAKGGTVLEPKLAADAVDTPRFGEVDGVNAVAVRCADGSLAVFAVNRSLDEASEFEIKLPEGAEVASVDARTLHDDDLFAANTLDDQNRVTLHANESAAYDAETGTVRVSLPPVSWNALHIK